MSLTICECGRALGWEETRAGWWVAHCPCGRQQGGAGERCRVCGGSGIVESLAEKTEITWDWLVNTDETLDDIQARESARCIHCGGKGVVLDVERDLFR